MGAEKMQGTPWHTEILKRGENGKRRNIANCILSHHVSKKQYICKCKQNAAYFERECHSCKSCEFYEE